MTWPTGPPPMPPSGWYDDPEYPFTWRYFDGGRWSDHRAPKWTPPVRDPQSFSAWFERSFACVKVALRRVGLVLAGLYGLVALLTFVASVVLLTGTDGRELRDLLGVGDGFGTTNTLTDSEADRVADLFGELFVDAVPWIIVVGVVFAIVSAWSWAIVARVSVWHLGQPDPADERSASRSESTVEIVGAALRRVPVVIGSSLLLGLVLLGLLALGTLPVVGVIVLDIGAAANVLTVLFVIGGVIALGVWLWGRLALAPVIAAIGGHGVGLGRSWRVTNGRFWYVVGRVVISSLIAGTISQVVSLVTNFGFVLDVVVLLAITFALQAATAVVSTIVQVSGMVVALEQVGRVDVAAGETQR